MEYPSQVMDDHEFDGIDPVEALTAINIVNLEDGDVNLEDCSADEINAVAHMDEDTSTHWATLMMSRESGGTDETHHDFLAKAHAIQNACREKLGLPKRKLSIN